MKGILHCVSEADNNTDQLLWRNSNICQFRNSSNSSLGSRIALVPGIVIFAVRWAANQLSTWPCSEGAIKPMTTEALTGEFLRLNDAIRHFGPHELIAELDRRLALPKPQSPFGRVSDFATQCAYVTDLSSISTSSRSHGRKRNATSSTSFFTGG